MTIWDKIYKNFQKSGETWATLTEDIHPLFKPFLIQSNFKIKHALDIGCGTGKYLIFLQKAGFKTDGIDSSETAVKMTKDLLNGNSTILCADMFEFEIPKNKYDLIVSIATIHHGTKDQVNSLVNKIYEAILDGGKIFITIPDVSSSKQWDTFKDHKKIAEGTFIPLSGPETGLPHSFFSKEEILKMFSKFKDIKLDLDETLGRWVVQGSK